MKSERWQQIEQLYHAALEHEAKRRASFLEQACDGDEELRREVESLLAYKDQAEDFIESPALEVAARMMAENHDMTIAPGQTINHYKISSLLGAGGMGEVYRALDTRLGREVALKLLPAAFSTDQDRLRRFEQEARAAGMLNHPNVLTIYDVGTHEGTPYIVSELLTGETLRGRLRRAPPPLRRVIDYALQIARGLAAAHEARIVHRDLKPENLFITRDGRVKILDFGIAKLTETKSEPVDSERETRLLELKTSPGMVLGTVGYMSPEQLLGDQVDQRADIFAFGAILYEMLAGRRAFEGDSAIEVMNAILKEEPAEISEAPAVPPALIRVVQHCLEKNREERFQSMADVAFYLEALPAASDRETSATAAGSPPLGLGRHWMPVTVLLVLVGLAIVAGAIGLGFYIHARNSEGAIDSIAVLPFENQNHDANTDYLSDGVTESIINSLTQFPNLKVIARSSVFRYKDKSTDPLAAAKELGVRAILTGRIMQRGDDLTISTELVDVRENKQLWGEQYNRKVSDLLAVQRDIAGEISNNLRLRLPGANARRQQYSDNPEAYQLYLKGRFFNNKRTEADARKAIDYFQQAVALDPNNALAYTGIADAYSHLVFPLDAIAPTEGMPKAREAATHALAIDNALSEAHASLAYEVLFYEWNLEVTEREFKRAIELNPNNADAHHWYSHYLMAHHRIDESLAESKRSLELSPIDLTVNVHLGWHYLSARQYDQALQQLNRVVDMDSNFPQTYMWLGLVFEQQQKYPEAIAAFQKAIALFPGGSTQTKAQLGHAFAVSGNRNEALKIIAELADVGKRTYVSPYQVAAIYAGLGDKEQMFTWLEKAYAERSDWLVNITNDQRFDDYRSDPRFAELVRRVGLQQ